MKARKLTRVQRAAFETISRHPKGILRQHVKGTGLVVWRLLDDKMNPIANFSEHVIYGLQSKDILEKRDDKTFIIHATYEQ